MAADSIDSGGLAITDCGFTPCAIGDFIGLFNYRNGGVNIVQILHVKQNPRRNAARKIGISTG